ncbi:OmpA family protein [Rhizobium sp. BK602]|uniref:OmpA family protein n=1 Tax=Rhizobium sp. BK602 TaxID=2586986 RepID=UPI0016224027|nr:OmpA family protein [Rhizobium sp. BK602]MBB3609911.1 outer membrane protein OmpA-like peptidoglycan-associated protein [Rhizobium sp. BK602]
MARAVGHNTEIERLKTLLFQSEEARLDTLEADVAFLQRYLGDADRLEAATADILVAALERAEVNRPRDLANAIAPSVVSAIRSEIANSRDMMVEALYPITGRMVSAAVANAFKQLVAFLEQRLNTLTSMELWIGRVKSLVTGRPISEFVLANSNPPNVRRLLLIERGAGRLIAEWTQEGTHDERADLLSAMVAAILEFSVQALAGEGNLQKLDFGGREIMLSASPRFILAAECTGLLRPADEARINALFLDEIESIDHGTDSNAAKLASLAAAIESDPRPGKKTSRNGKVILLTLLAVAAALFVWLATGFVTRTMLEHRTNAALQQLAQEQPLLASFPLQLSFDHGNRSVTVSGVEPSSLDPAPVVNALARAAAPYQVVNRMGMVPGLEQSATLRTDLASMQNALQRLQASSEEMRAAAAAAAESKDQQYASLNKQYVDLQARLQASIAEARSAIVSEAESRHQQYAGLQAIADSPAQRLGRFLATTAIFFGKGDEFVDVGEAERQIGQLAALLSGNDLRIRIVGYADESGSEQSNKVLAGKRAEAVAQRLKALGIEPARLFVVSRSAAMPISDRMDAGGSANRRVAFENVFQTEPAQ